ncbi:cell wall hydrolase [Alkalihalobacillus trypoxylicola]|uniref:Peptidoglycan-binding protein n=1 Tax=Alkalihalobacillus trypoxylicola TaxID=519424 RepID=A0A162EEK5_9BACI|nr:cell wall hydrolase [Alkalihalobacillus trypoxylicola]KYG32391.1 peptidoglycan-binding protein [Alkalihalobacillus trypoxylicola]
MKKFTMSFLAVASLAFLNIDEAKAQSNHTVKEGESLYKIGQQYGVAVQSLKEMNERNSNLIMVGEVLQIPESISEAEKDLLARLVRAEAQGEPYAGKVAVATVVLNRVQHTDFPDTITEVIQEVTPSGHYAFTPYMNGEINKPADAESKAAVNEALAFDGQGQGSIFFYNPQTATNHWNATRTETITIGKHVFSK